MKHIPNRTEFINENAVRVGKVFKVRTTYDIPVSEVNAFARKMKEEKGDEVMDNWSPAEIAEAMANYVLQKYMNSDSIPVSAITGDEEDLDAELGAEGGEGAQMVQPGAQMVQPQMVQPGAEAQNAEITEPAMQPLTVGEKKSAALKRIVENKGKKK